MDNPALKNALTWSIFHSQGGSQGSNTPELTQEMVNTVFGPLAKPMSDADMMKYSMAAIKSPEISRESKLTAFNNFNDLIEEYDNAISMEPQGLWTPLADELDNTDWEFRTQAVRGVHLAAHNNPKGQERVLSLGLVPKLVEMAVSGHEKGERETVVPDREKAEQERDERKMAILALSSTVRNCQPALDAAWNVLPDKHKPSSKPDASEMSQVSEVIQSLRDSLPTIPESS